MNTQANQSQEQLIDTQAAELSDEDLDHVVGGRAEPGQEAFRIY